MPAELDSWMTRIESRHLANLQFPEVSRALRALSSAYVERRATAISRGRVLDTSGKRAAFALYYGPLHYLAARDVLRALGIERRSPALPVIDLGCGTGAVGAAVAAATGAGRVLGIDLHPWSLDEASDTYAAFGLTASTTRASVARFRQPASPATIVAAYVANELPDAERQQLQEVLIDALRHGSSLLIVEPLSRRAAPWWPDWVERFAPLGARADTWSLSPNLPDLTERLGRAAGLRPMAKIRTIARL